MPRKLKLTLSLDEDLVEELERISRKTKKPRSRLVQEALRIWQRTELQEKLAQGYREMADENLEMAEQGLSAFNETQK
ncbi:MAG: DUF6364 family protein [Candidatus Bipolaricaulia bacterium]